ncbi:MAG: hypothetical protein P1P84_02585 [Deferrisomatales bacterium]|nr:hypothetical protein [Deferrisomatales bacterium]
MTRTLTETVVLNRSTPTRDYANLVSLTLRANRVAITSDVTRVVLELTNSLGVTTTLDSDDSDFTFTWSSGVLSMDLSGAISTTGTYDAELDVWIDGSPYRWTTITGLELKAV